ncbi:PAN domain protein [Teladorsagia circumcincta]|uniref:PAN domain protein n=1 Tax=Teladorsagia circumcincta TaxID=45464 RepID=A0A2G9UK14_TELCI|nr:PAN domain protein [Teladorsagia circumcincta]
MPPSDCVGVEFISGNCKVFGAGKEQPTPGAKVLMKNCVKSERVCSSPFHFDLFEQKILVGFAREVVPAESIQVCMSACLNSFDTFGFECESAMFYPVDQECILNTEDRLDRPDLFADEAEDQVIYMDNNCAGSQCYAPYITQYIAVEGKQLENELDRIINVDVDSCQSLCTQRLSLTVNDFNCKSFMYNNVSRTCILSDERSKPLGRGTLIKTEGFTYYEKKCFASPNTCRNIPSFTRVPQMILVGFAAFVMENVPSVTMCLDQCTNPPPETGDNFECKSVMYYYNEQECILNAETRHSKPDLFIPEGDEFQVDYFDITCHLKPEKCPAGTHLKAIRTVNAALPEGEGDLHVLKAAAKGVKECFGTSPDKCRSFNYDKQAGTCNLLYLDSMATLRPQIRQGTDLYDLRCLADMPLVEGDCSINKDDALFSRYLHTKQRGIASKTYKVVSLNSCLEVCAGNPTDRFQLSVYSCAGVNYNRRVGQCDIFDAIDGEADVNEHVDFYKNLCVIKETDSGVSAAANVPPQTHRMSGTVTNKKKDSRGELLATKKVKPSIREHEQHRRKPEATLPIGPPVSIPPNAIHTICNYEGIKLNGTYKTTVVIQTNNLGIPGLVTSMDQLYEVSCDYSSMLGGKVQAGYNMTVLGPEPNLIQPRGKIELGNPVFMQLAFANSMILQAKLGDILELRWEIMAMDDELDFFVKDCFAEPGVGAKAEEKLQLIQGGVPKHARATTSIVIIDPLQQVQEPVSLARASAIDFMREEAEEIPVSTAGQMCLAKPTLVAVFGLLLTLTTVQAIVVIQYLVRRLYRSTKF